MYVCIYWINIYLCDNVYLFTGFIYPNILSHQTQPTPLCPQFLRLNYWLYFMRSIVLVCWCCKALQMNVLFSWDDKIFDTFFEKFYSNPYIMFFKIWNIVHRIEMNTKGHCGKIVCIRQHNFLFESSNWCCFSATYNVFKTQFNIFFKILSSFIPTNFIPNPFDLIL